MRQDGMIRRAGRVVFLALIFCQGAVLAAEPGSGFSPGLQEAGKIVNFILLMGLLVYLLREPIRHYFHSRTAEIQKKLEDAENAKMDALRKLKLMEERLQKLDEEVAAIRRQAEADAEMERQLIDKHTEEDVARMRHGARVEIEGHKRQAIAELRRFAADEAVRLAEGILRRELRDEDEERMFSVFLEKMGDKQ